MLTSHTTDKDRHHSTTLIYAILQSIIDKVTAEKSERLEQKTIPAPSLRKSTHTFETLDELIELKHAEKEIRLKNISSSLKVTEDTEKKEIEKKEILLEKNPFGRIIHKTPYFTQLELKHPFNLTDHKASEFLGLDVDGTLTRTGITQLIAGEKIRQLLKLAYKKNILIYIVTSRYFTEHEIDNTSDFYHCTINHIIDQLGRKYFSGICFTGGHYKSYFLKHIHDTYFQKDPDAIKKIALLDNTEKMLTDCKKHGFTTIDASKADELYDLLNSSEAEDEAESEESEESDHFTYFMQLASYLNEIYSFILDKPMKIEQYLSFEEESSDDELSDDVIYPYEICDNEISYEENDMEDYLECSDDAAHMNGEQNKDDTHIVQQGP